MRRELDASFDLINADYLVGLPLTFRLSGFSGRARIYHQSSHPGDEFILNRQPDRVNLSFESLELILSQEVGPLRVYAGGETFFSREPADLPERLAHGGMEIRISVSPTLGLFVGSDAKFVDADEWEPAWSVRGGLDIGRIAREGRPPRIISLVGVFHEGLAPYGQFYRENIRYWGFGFGVTL